VKKALIIVGCFAIAAIAQLGNVGKLQEKFGLASRIGDDVFASAFEEHRGNFVAEGSGTVTRVLSDDNGEARTSDSSSRCRLGRPC